MGVLGKYSSDAAYLVGAPLTRASQVQGADYCEGRVRR